MGHLPFRHWSLFGDWQYFSGMKQYGKMMGGKMIGEAGAGAETQKWQPMGFNPNPIFSFLIILPPIILPDLFGVGFFRRLKSYGDWSLAVGIFRPARPIGFSHCAESPRGQEVQAREDGYAQEDHEDRQAQARPLLARGDKLGVNPDRHRLGMLGDDRHRAELADRPSPTSGCSP